MRFAKSSETRLYFQGRLFMPNAIEMLREDHRKVKDLFEHFEGTDSGDRKEIVDTTLRELEVHTSIEEEIFYPAARLALQELDGEEGDDTIDEAWEEHHVVKLLSAELKKCALAMSTTTLNSPF